ncbi:hypothetical protein DFJ43DRAFT_1089419 [Lentinula guzmanii]|uniref:Chromo domain-containing protein n=1 Tax=Lentinula guzmanii TaxID=2804957 RepID=A0AA38MXI1_9AGAR|nr:hypothetical protein DFJ43DRAFT_1089419 [Lentinula guzmanii]
MGNRSRKKARLEEEESGSEKEVFQVEYFKKARVDEDGRWEYLVKWFGYDGLDDDTWEPPEHIANCQRLLSSFWQEVGGDDDDYFPGYECAPSQEWINKEKARFARMNPDLKDRIEAQKAQETEQERKREERRQKQARKSAIAQSVPKKTFKTTISQNNPRESSSTVANVRVKEESNGGVPVPSKPISGKENIAERATQVKKTKKLAAISSDSSSESDSLQHPLIQGKQGKRKRSSGKATSEKIKDEGIKQVALDLFPEEEETSVSVAGNMSSLFTPEQTATNNKSRKYPEGKEQDSSSHPIPESLMANPLRAEARKKPSLPRLSSVRPETSASKSDSAPPLFRLNIPATSLPKTSIPARLRTDSPVSASGISTKQRLMQGALQMTTPTENVPEVSRPLPLQKLSSLSGMSFRKNRGPSVKTSPTIATADMSLKNVPFYSPQETPSSISANAHGMASPSRLTAISAELPPNLSRKPTEPEAQASDQMIQDKVPIVSPTAESSIRTNLQGLKPSHDFMPSPVMSAPSLRLLPPISTSKTSTLNDKAESFLRSVIPVTEAARMDNQLTSKSPSVSQPYSSKDAIWTGKIMLETDDNNEARPISIEGMLLPSDPSAGRIALQQGVMPLKVAMSYNDSKLLMKSRLFYKLGDLTQIVAACGPVQEWGWLAAEEEEDVHKLNKVIGFLSHEKLVGFVPVVVEGSVVAMTLIHSSTMTHDCLPRVQSSDFDDTTLVVSLYSWVLKHNDLSLDKAQKHFVHRLDDAWKRRDFALPQGMYEAYGEPGIKALEGLGGSKPMMKHAVRILELSELLHSYLMSGGERPFALWPPADSDAFCVSPIPRIEMESLLALLSEYPATINRGTVGTKQDLSLRVIFVHVNSLGPGSRYGNIRDMPGLSEYRIINDVRFIAYGSSDVVNPRFPNIMEEIWHIGGIVTFTANALLSDPLGISARIYQIEEHEFWMCHMLPAVIGMTVSVTYRGREHLIQKRIACNALEHGARHAQARSVVMNADEDDVDEPVPCTCDGFAYEWLLDAIDEELISIVGAPPLHGSDPILAGSGSITHQGIPRDGRPRKMEEWKQLSDNLLASSTSMNMALYSLTPHSTAQRQVSPSPKEAQYNDPFEFWVLQLFDNDVRNRSETLAFCIQEFKRLCDNVAQEEWEDVIKREIMEELGRMQISRGFREELRRFVIVAGSEDKDLQTGKGGFEWVTEESFRFHDVTDHDLNTPHTEL